MEVGGSRWLYHKEHTIKFVYSNLYMYFVLKYTLYIIHYTLYIIHYTLCILYINDDDRSLHTHTHTHTHTHNVKYYEIII